MKWLAPVAPRTPAVLIAALGLLVACTPDPAVTNTTAPAASSTSTSTSTTTTTPAATSTASTTTSTAAAATTAPPDSETLLAVGRTCLLGWWDGDWLSGDLLPVSGGETYQVVRLDEPITTTTGSGARPFCDPLDLVSVEFEPEIPGGFLEIDALAIQSGGSVRPHPVELLGLSQPAYIEATSELLENRVARVPIINLTQVIRADLEGDGVEEVIVAASTIPDDLISAQVGDYSIVYVRKVIEGEVQTAILAESIIEDPDNLFSELAIFTVAAVADLNGDGKMEIVLDGIAWESAFLQAFEYANDDLGPVEVLSCGCGS